MFIDDIAVFGPGLLDAYEAERDNADMPRVILTPSAAEAESDYRAHYPKSETYPILHCLCTDADGRRFVNYLNAGLIDGGLIARHQDAVQAKLGEFQTSAKVLRKYRWVAEYHNAFCAKHPAQFAQRIIL